MSFEDRISAGRGDGGENYIENALTEQKIIGQRTSSAEDMIAKKQAKGPGVETVTREQREARATDEEAKRLQLKEPGISHTDGRKTDVNDESLSEMIIRRDQAAGGKGFSAIERALRRTIGGKDFVDHYSKDGKKGGFEIQDHYSKDGKKGGFEIQDHYSKDGKKGGFEIQDHYSKDGKKGNKDFIDHYADRGKKGNKDFVDHYADRGDIGKDDFVDHYSNRGKKDNKDFVDHYADRGDVGKKDFVDHYADRGDVGKKDFVDHYADRGDVGKDDFKDHYADRGDVGKDDFVDHYSDRGEEGKGGFKDHYSKDDNKPAIQEWSQASQDDKEDRGFVDHFLKNAQDEFKEEKNDLVSILAVFATTKEGANILNNAVREARNEGDIRDGGSLLEKALAKIESDQRGSVLFGNAIEKVAQDGGNETLLGEYRQKNAFRAPVALGGMDNSIERTETEKKASQEFKEFMADFYITSREQALNKKLTLEEQIKVLDFIQSDTFDYITGSEKDEIVSLLRGFASLKAEAGTLTATINNSPMNEKEEERNEAVIEKWIRREKEREKDEASKARAKAAARAKGNESLFDSREFDDITESHEKYDEKRKRKLSQAEREREAKKRGVSKSESKSKDDKKPEGGDKK